MISCRTCLVISRYSNTNSHFKSGKCIFSPKNDDILKILPSPQRDPVYSGEHVHAAFSQVPPFTHGLVPEQSTKKRRENILKFNYESFHSLFTWKFEMHE